MENDFVFWVVLGALFGGSWGSFLYVVYVRTPQMIKQFRTKEKMALWWSEPRSSCEKCSNQLSWYDNIPIISWMILMGKCRKCYSPISYKYCLWELVCAILGALAVWEMHWYGVALFILFLVIMTIIELVWRYIDNKKNIG